MTIGTVEVPSLLVLAQEGEIPNPLLGAAARLFQRGMMDAARDGEGFLQTAETLVRIAKASLVEPSWAELEQAGLTLTDLQLMYLYNFVQTGVDSLRSFRDGKKAAAPAADGAAVQRPAK